MDIVQLWKDASNDKIASVVVSIFLLFCLVLIAVYVVGWFRSLAVGKAEELNPLADIEQLRADGKISQFEYLRLKQSAKQSITAMLEGSRKSDGEPMTLKEAEMKKSQATRNTRQPGAKNNDNPFESPES
jgi:hypothetical protein